MTPNFPQINRMMGFKSPLIRNAEKLAAARTDEQRADLEVEFAEASHKAFKRQMHIEDREATTVESTSEKVKSFSTSPWTFKTKHGKLRASQVPPVNMRTGKLNARRVVRHVGERELVHVHILDSQPGILDRARNFFKLKKERGPGRYVNPQQAEQQAKRRRQREEKRMAQA